MFNKLLSLKAKNRHIYSFLFSAICMTLVLCISSLYSRLTDGDAVNVALLLILGLIIISCNTVRYLYGLLCSLAACLWLGLTQEFPRERLIVTFLIMSAATVFVSFLTAYLTARSREQEKRLAEAEMEKNRANLLRAISHDLRTPLSGILGNSLIFLENQALLSEPEKKQIVTNIRESSEWMISMAENLLTITRISQEGPAIHTSDEIVEEVIGEVLQKMEKRHSGCKIRVKIPEDFIILPMDVVLIEQVILNLLENALLHSGSDEPVDMIVTEEKEQVTFIIRDYGTGIPKSMLGRLFEGTYYSAVHAPDAQKGMGIGLVICKTIIDAHQGTILGRNHKNGAEFIFTLPKKREEDLS